MRHKTREWLQVALFAIGVSAAGCGADEAGNDSDVVGGACSNDDDCASGSRCEDGGDFPDGLCTFSCTTHEDCPAFARCIHKEGGICMLECASDSDCRSGYKCKDEANEEGGKSLICKK
jgi:hypothetical protein